MKLKVTLSALVAVFGTLSLLALGLLISPAASGNVANFFLYQAVALLVSFAAILSIRLIAGKAFDYFKVGNLAGRARPLRALGISERDTWRRVGVTFLFVISLATFAYMLLNSEFNAEISIGSWLTSLALAIPLAALNSWNEEIISRWTIVEGFGDAYAKAAPTASALIFGVIHYFGTPGGLLGLIMATFLGFLLARSIQDTKGIGWAWAIHFVQDIIILSFILVSVL